MKNSNSDRIIKSLFSKLFYSYKYYILNILYYMNYSSLYSLEFEYSVITKFIFMSNNLNIITQKMYDMIHLL